jgi:hypothetical protein
MRTNKRLENKLEEEKEKRTMVRVLIDLPGRGEQAHEYTHCVIMRHGEGRICPIGGGECRYGLTEIAPPNRCPMRSGKFLTEIIMKFSIVEREI